MSKPTIIAFYLPQYHPVKENNEWFGDGYTEWTNVAKAKALFKGHDQPRIPRDLGFYDLRLPEVRKMQAALAKEAGIDAFCYYHYWFGNGKVLLEKPLQEVIKLGEPDFPFCLCWANHSWYKKNWNPDVKKIEEALLLEQTYPGEDDIIQHFKFLLPAFKDRRYYKINGRCVFVLYNITGMPNFLKFKTIWNKLAEENDLKEFYFISYTTKVDELNKEIMKETEGTILSLHSNIEYKQNFSVINRFRNKLRHKVSELTGKPTMVYQYEEAINYFLVPQCSLENVIPVIVPNWDYTPRRGAGGLILKNATPELFSKHVEKVIEAVKNKPSDKQIIFIKSWNEWGEGNYMEPDLTYGKGYIEAMNKVLNNK